MEMNKRVTRRQWEVGGANPIVQALNGEVVTGAPRERLIQVLGDLQMLDGIYAQVRVIEREHGVYDCKGGFTNSTVESLESVRALERQGAPILARLNKQLLRSRWSMLLKSFSHPQTELLRVYDFHTKNENARSAELAINFLLQHYMPNGEIGKFRKCSECSRWFFAVTDHQKYCSEKCRLRYVSHSDQFKRKRRTFMKEYRKREKELNQQAKQQAQRKGR